MGVIVRQKVKGKGKPWWVFVSHNGKRMSRSIGTKKAAKKAAQEIEEQLGLGKFGIEKPEEEPKEIPTFGEYAEKWLKFVESQTRGKDPQYRKSTLDEHIVMLQLHILPVFKDRNLDTITKGEIRDFLISKLSNLSKGRTSAIKGVVSNIFNLAVDDEIIPANPTAGFSKRLLSQKGGRKPVEKTDVFTPDELELLLETCKNDFSKNYVFFLTAARTGMRLGELLALEWDDIDFNSRYILIRRSHRRGRNTKTKTNKIRQTDISDQLASALKGHLSICKKDALKRGKSEVEGLVFNHNRVNREGYINRQYRRILKMAGLRYIKFHGLRHAFCAHLLSNGISPYYVSKQVGHSSIAITCDVYGSWISSNETRHVNTLDSTHFSAPYTHPGEHANSAAA